MSVMFSWNSEISASEAQRRIGNSLDIVLIQKAVVPTHYQYIDSSQARLCKQIRHLTQQGLYELQLLYPIQYIASSLYSQIR